ncbi:methionine aminotransferase [Siphonobacter sp. SORGH_AS_0500]|uniref:methionine aminotransferase n=1 Tax=Siphonobacter sp. SORGH_AS_0500 TaxID=1864824 RepID=UPI002855EDA3|nr:methionine aminotransferase [Siphonobacter sp. SORGH_AS_0500]MDR6195404.1 methionine aminotransferase [Siphonobacter sp. SORGH_AS_0500]
MKTKLPNVGTTIFTTMSQLAQQHGALNLSQGFPSFDAAPELINRVEAYLRKAVNQYAPMTGVAPLREMLAQKTEQISGLIYHPEREITVTSGATEALFAAISAVVSPGDEVIIFEPAYDSYVPAIELNGGVPVFISLQAPDFKVSWSEVSEKITDRTRLMIINTPHNPTGQVWHKDDLNQLASLIKEREIYLVADEVYEHITFDGIPHVSVAQHPDLFERTFVCSSFGKTFHITGWKVGYCLAPAELSTEFRKIHQYLTFSTVTPIQFALADYLQEPEHYLSVAEFYQQKRDFFLKNLEGSAFSWKPSQGTFFQSLSYQGLSEEGDAELAIRLTREYGIASIPTSVFYQQKNDQKLLRFCFAKDNNMLQQAAERLLKIQW